MRTHYLLYGIAALALAAVAACALSAGRTPNLKGDVRKLVDTPPQDAEERTEEFEYFIAGEKKTGTRQVLRLDLGNNTRMDFVRIKAGKFQMGSPDSDKDAKDVEKPRHEVEITKDFYLGKHPVTQEQYEALRQNNHSYFPGGRGRLPVEQATWEEAQAFCKALSDKAHRTAALPTEAQWEYACRAGTETRFYCGDELTAQDANFDFHLNHPNSVGSYPPNPWGLYDMHGNVWQWCADYYDPKYYGRMDKMDPENTDKSDGHVFRGGSWADPAGWCRDAYRLWGKPGYRNYTVGFRVCLHVD